MGNSPLSVGCMDSSVFLHVEGCQVFRKGDNQMFLCKGYLWEMTILVL